ncbi:hypothetical protein [Gorillibacterium sp. CAU 1737]|uniref:hypothetical protein n=1 Tax=Gorillibacterium sp. CAU 1737 TaxID=3140362 RepID=UPI00325FEAB9
MKKTANRILLLAMIGGSLILSAWSDRQEADPRDSAVVSFSPAIHVESGKEAADSPEALRQLAYTQAAAAAGRSLDGLEAQEVDPNFPIEAPTFPAPSVTSPPEESPTPTP